MATEPMIRTEADRDPEFADWFTDLVGEEKLRECIHCGICTGSCPLASHMDFGPRKLMHLARQGFSADVLGSNTIWLCTSCYACTVACPEQIPVTDVMYALKRRAIEGGQAPRKHPVVNLAKGFTGQVHRRGRMTEAYLIAGLALRSGVLRYVGMAGVGWNSVRTGRISLLHDQIERKEELRNLLDAVEQHGGEVAVR
jgi:heterodisulfide reductase subunit C